MVLIRGHVSALIEFDPELLDHPIPNRTHEAHGNQDQIHFHGEFAAWYRLELRRTPNANRVQLRHPSVGGAGKFRSSNTPVAYATFLVSAFDTQLHRPQRPGRLWRALIRRLRHNLELVDRQRLLPMTSPEAIGARVATANDHYAFPSRENIRVRRKSVTLTAPLLLRQAPPRIIDSLPFAPRDFHITLLLRPARQHNRVKFMPQILAS